MCEKPRDACNADLPPRPMVPYRRRDTIGVGALGDTTRRNGLGRRRLKDTTMTRLLRRIHFNRRTVARLNNAIMVGLFGCGLFACMIGASVYDIGRLFSAW
jgi:hypothetical protein